MAKKGGGLQLMGLLPQLAAGDERLHVPHLWRRGGKSVGTHK